MMGTVSFQVEPCHGAPPPPPPQLPQLVGRATTVRRALSATVAHHFTTAAEPGDADGAPLTNTDRSLLTPPSGAAD